MCKFQLSNSGIPLIFEADFNGFLFGPKLTSWAKVTRFDGTFMQTKRNVLGDTIPGTQMFHDFFPIHIGVIAYKMTSEDPSFYGCRNFFTAKSNSQVPTPLQRVPQHFVACIYDDDWWIGMVEGIEGDMVNINFMHIKRDLFQTLVFNGLEDLTYVRSTQKMCFWTLIRQHYHLILLGLILSVEISSLQLKEFSIIVTMFLFNFMCSKLIYTYKLSIVTENRLDPP